MPARFEFPAVALDDGLKISLKRIREPKIRGSQLNSFSVFNQLTDLTKGLKIAVVENRDAVADILNVVEAMAAHQDRLALRTQVENQFLHPDRAQGIQT